MTAAEVVDLAARRVTVGGSDAAAACGLDPYRSRIALWLEKTGRSERPETEAMLWGKRLEPVIADVLEHEGYALLPAPADGFRDEARPWLAGHPDFFVALDGDRAVLDVKTAGPFVKGWAGDESPPTAYLVQLHHYMHLTGCERGMLACLVAGQRLVTRFVERDDEAITIMLNLESEFVGMVERGTPPEPDGSASAADALRAMFPESIPEKRVRLGKRELAAYDELVKVRRALDASKKRADELKQRLQLKMGDADTALGPDDRVLLTWHTSQRTALDTAALKKARPDVYEEFASSTQVRRFEVKS